MKNNKWMLVAAIGFLTVFCSGNCIGTSNYGGPDTSESAISAPYKNGTSNAPSDPFSKGNCNKAKPLGSPTGASTIARTDQSWCVAMNNVPRQKLQAALDYACGIKGVDCRPIQPGATCFQPDNLVSHASYAFNDFYHMEMISGTCDFHGTAVTIYTDPSYENCRYPPSGGFSLVNRANGGTSDTSVGFVPRSPCMPSMARSVLINLVLVAVLKLSYLSKLIALVCMKIRG